MTLLLAFSLTLLVAVLLSERGHRTVLSATVLFLAVGFMLGPGVTGWVALQPSDPVVKQFARLALFSILFVDAMDFTVHELVGSWRLPSRALLLGMPVTVLLVALLGHWLLGLPWLIALLLGAILSPTDPVFAAALLDRESVPLRLRRLLSIESGLNDGLALPLVMVFLELARQDSMHPLSLLLAVGGGVVIGVALPWIYLRLERLSFFGFHRKDEALGILGVALLLWALQPLLHFNEYLASFAAGVTVATVNRDAARRFSPLGRQVAEAVKLMAILIFGTLLTPALFTHVGGKSYLFAFIVLVAIRPLALALSFLSRRLTRREWLAAAWFGPKGFASVVYALLAYGSVRNGDRLFELVALVTAASMVAHSSTDVLVARTFRQEEQRAAAEGEVPADEQS